VQIDPEPLEEEIAKQVKDANRKHELDNKELPIRLTIIDGKGIGTTKYKVDEHSINRSQKGCTKYVQHVLRAFHASSSLKVLMGQQRVPVGTNEKGIFPIFLEKLVKHYGKTKLLEVLSFDAGFLSMKNAKAIVEQDLFYIMALKDPRVHTVTRMAMKLFEGRAKPDKVEKERVNGKEITRKLFRAPAPKANGWSHATQVWLIQKEVLHSSGKISSHSRYFVTNLPRQRLSHAQVLKAIRLHWSIENNANWVLDVAWKEDSRPWCNEAIELLSLMRMIAYNVVARFKVRRLRRATVNNWTWAQTLAFIKAAIFPPRLLQTATTL